MSAGPFKYAYASTIHPLNKTSLQLVESHELVEDELKRVSESIAFGFTVYDNSKLNAELGVGAKYNLSSS